MTSAAPPESPTATSTLQSYFATRVGGVLVPLAATVLAFLIGGADGHGDAVRARGIGTGSGAGAGDAGCGTAAGAGKGACGKCGMKARGKCADKARKLHRQKESRPKAASNIMQLPLRNYSNLWRKGSDSNRRYA